MLLWILFCLIVLKKSNNKDITHIMSKYTVYTFRSKRGCEAYVKTHSIEEALELARKAGENLKLTDLKIQR